MADQWNTGPSGSGERWNVNLPAVVGVVFVFLVGVVIWVIASADSDDELAIDGSSPDTSVAVTTTPPSSSLALVTVPIITSPVPLPVTSPPTPLTTPPATVPATVAPVVPPPTHPPPPPATQAPTPTTTVPGPTTTIVPVPAPDGGDLGVPGHPIQRPPCDGSAITIIASAIGDEATPDSMGGLLDGFPGSHYLRTDQTCPSLTQAQNGEPVFVVYFGPFAEVSDACEARSDGPADSYVRRLSTDLPPGHGVSCN